MVKQDKTQLGTRVKYINNDGDLTQTGTVIGPVDDLDALYGHVKCDCGDDPKHPDVWVKWDNGTKAIYATCRLKVVTDQIEDPAINAMISEGGPV